MPHVGFRPIQESLEFQTVRISVGYHISNLANNGCKYENANQITDYRKNISETKRKAKHEQFSKDISNKNVRRFFKVFENKDHFVQPNNLTKKHPWNEYQIIS